MIILQIIPGSVADKCGLKEKDIIVRINDTSTINLGHFDVHEIIMGCANNFVFGVSRDGEEDVVEENCPIDSPGHVDAACEVETQLNGANYETVDEKTLFGDAQSPDTRSVVSEITVYSNGAGSNGSEISQRGPKPFVSPITKPEPAVKTEDEATEERIAEIMSGEAEVLKEHNVLG